MDPHCFIVQVVYLVVGKVFEEQSHRVGDKSQRTPSDDQVGGRALSHLWTKTVGFSEKKIDPHPSWLTREFYLAPLFSLISATTD